jgi:hypothetical protein
MIGGRQAHRGEAAGDFGFYHTAIGIMIGKALAASHPCYTRIAIGYEMQFS